MMLFSLLFTPLVVRSTARLLHVPALCVAAGVELVDSVIIRGSDQFTVNKFCAYY